MPLATLLAPRSTAERDIIRVMIVEDSATIRGLFAPWLAAEPDMRVVASVPNGRVALEQVERADPDVILLDVEMPELDGLSALPLLLRKKRDAAVIMVSALTRQNAEISLRALSLGAADYIAKPDTKELFGSAAGFQRELIEKVRALGGRVLQARLVTMVPPVGPTAPRSDTVIPLGRYARTGRDAQAPSLRPFPPTPPRVVLFGASTGGPQALMSLIEPLRGVIDHAPVLITQHMPPTFTAIFAEHLGRVSRKPVREGTDGEVVRAGHVYVAPGGRHMRVARRNGTATIVIDDGPPVNFCRPAVDPLFESAADVWGPWNLAVVLTGMGQDGLKGADAIVKSGGAVMAQDEPTSVVWGMPGAIAQAGLCSAVLPLDRIAPKLVRLMQGGRT